jgi:chaperonin GroES
VDQYIGSSLSDIDGVGMHADATGNELKPPPPEHLEKLTRWAKSVNIALEVDDNGDPEISSEVLQVLGSRVEREYKIDDTSRSDWKEKTEKAMELAMQHALPKQYPWPKSANVIFPLMTTAAMQFAARAYPAIVMGKAIVKGVVIGSDDGVPAMGRGPDGKPSPAVDQSGQIQWIQPPGIKQQRADRISEHMSFQLLDEQPEWEEETDKLLHILPIVGCCFRKSFFNSGQGRNSSLMVSALKLVINYKAKSMETAPRLTEEIEFYPIDIENMERSGEFRPITYTGSQGQGDDLDAPIEFLEQHRWYDLDDDGYPEPYTVTIEKQSTQVVRIVARFDIEDVHWNATKGRIQKIEPTHYYTKYDFFPNPEGGIYGVGFGQLLKPINEAVNTTLNMMLDAGHLQVVGGGFIGKGLSMNTGAVRFQPGEWKPVNAQGATVSQSLVPLPAPGPSPILFQLLGMLVEAGKEVASVKDVLTGEKVPANTPATTMLAMIEQGLQQFTAIFKRVHRSLKKELAKLYRLNRIYLEQETSYKVGNEWKQITKADYEKGAGVEPISDPTMVSDMQKLGRAQLLMTLANDPLMQKQKIFKRFLESANIDNIDELFNPNPPPNPLIIEKMQTLALKERHDSALIVKEEAQSLLYRAQAINQIAQADAAVGQQDVAWAEHQLDSLRAQMEMMGQQPGQAPGGDAGAQPQSEPAPQPAPSPPAFHPAMVGAVQAPDKNHYLSDPSRPGKFIRIHHAPARPEFHPEMIGAKQAPDREHYIKDPSRPGQFIHVGF